MDTRKITKCKHPKLTLVRKTSVEKTHYGTDIPSDLAFNMQAEKVRRNFEAALKRLEAEHVSVTSKGERNLRLILK